MHFNEMQTVENKIYFLLKILMFQCSLYLNNARCTEKFDRKKPYTKCRRYCNLWTLNILYGILVKSKMGIKINNFQIESIGNIKFFK